MRTSCVNHPGNHPMIQIKRWQVEFCDGNVTAAALMSFFEYWHNIKIDMSSKNKTANDVAETHNEVRSQDESLWQFHTTKELEDGVFVAKKDTIAKALDILVAKGIVEIGRNPNQRYKFDRTRFFLFSPEVANQWIYDNYPAGYGESRNRLSQLSSAPLDSRKVADPKSENRSLSPENRLAITETSLEISKETRKGIPPPLSESTTTTGDTNMDIALKNHEDRKSNGGNRYLNGWQAELNLKLPAKQRVPLVEVIADACGLTAKIKSDENTLKKVHEQAIVMYEMGNTDPEQVKSLYNMWLSDEWRAKNKRFPKLFEFSDFASQARQLVESTESNTRNGMTIVNHSGTGITVKGDMFNMMNRRE